MVVDSFARSELTSTLATVVEIVDGTDLMVVVDSGSKTTGGAGSVCNWPEAASVLAADAGVSMITSSSGTNSVVSSLPSIS